MNVKVYFTSDLKGKGRLQKHFKDSLFEAKYEQTSLLIARVFSLNIELLYNCKHLTKYNSNVINRLRGRVVRAP